MKALFTGLLFFTTYCIAQQNNSPQYSTLKDFAVISTGNHSPQNSKLLIICFNKYFNKNKFNDDFIKKSLLDQINYSENMAVQIFLGDVKEKIINLKVDKIEETETNINVYYSYEVSKSSQLSETSSPFVIIETDKSKKRVVFYENGINLNSH